ncbi:25408_t:CDS:2 [Dentiscutata erythropus]|uniref:25408_t:CDS:1 n=1 Tax=Dentiscutata erythropus TaxID=1348616 RepID=A0A9N9DXT7_9GLOM|nr:25408_t:CDS:2 [Dentiscutata erythropus]
MNNNGTSDPTSDQISERCVVKEAFANHLSTQSSFSSHSSHTSHSNYTHQRPNQQSPVLMAPKRRKALLIGINYFKTKFELKGCLNDVANIKAFLVDLYGFPEDKDHMLILTDDPRQKDPTKIPTKANILNGMKWLVKDAQPGDSGHGGQEKDLDGDEIDGYDETIMPLDFEKKGQIIDDVMHNIMVRPLPAGAKLTAIFDSCHSGTALDLPFIYSTGGIEKKLNIFCEGTHAIVDASLSYLRGDAEGIKTTFKSFTVKAMHGQEIEEKIKITNYSAADVIMFSGCKDTQTSADIKEAGQSTGAMSYAFIKTLKAKKNQTYQELLNNIRDILSLKYTQKPQLSASHETDMNLPFYM